MQMKADLLTITQRVAPTGSYLYFDNFAEIVDSFHLVAN